MKNALKIMMIIGSIFIASFVYAADGDSVEVGTGTSVGGGPLTFQPSPSTSMLTDTSATAYNILAWSNKNVGVDAGMQYLTSSSVEGVYQMKLGATAPTTAGTAGTTIDGFVQKE